MYEKVDKNLRPNSLPPTYRAMLCLIDKSCESHAGHS